MPQAPPDKGSYPSEQVTFSDERWLRHQKTLMRQAPEMGIALLNVDRAAPPLIFSKGAWERISNASDHFALPGKSAVAASATSLDAKCRALVIWGLGLGYWYLHLRPWLRQDRSRQLIFCESEVMSATAFLHMPWAEELLNDPQVHVRAHFSGERERRALREIAWLCLLLPLEFRVNEYGGVQSESEQKRFKDAEQAVRGAQGQFDQLASELLHFSEPFYKNFYTNYLRQSQTLNARFLKGAFEDLPALICGAGPSVKDQIGKLAALKDQILLVAGGSAVNSLIAQGLTPHFGVAIDPNPMQEQRIRSHTGFDLPVFFRRRLFAAGLDAICGPRILVDGGAGYPLVEWLDEQCCQDEGAVQTIDEGHNVMHFAIDLARHVGSKKVLLAGMDLAYDQTGGYAPGVLSGHVGAKILPEGLCCDEPLIPYPNDRGELITTHWKWVEESLWIGEYAQRMPSVHLSNATPGGLGIQGVIRVELGKHLPLTRHPARDLTNRVWLELERAAPFERGINDPIELLDPIWQSLSRCEKLLKKMHKGNREAELIEQVRSGSAGLLFAEVEEEIAYQLILRFADQMHKVVSMRALRWLGEGGDCIENWPIEARAVSMRQRADFLLRGCALHQSWWRKAQSIAGDSSSADRPRHLTAFEHKGPSCAKNTRPDKKEMGMERLRQRLARLGKRSQINGELVICEPSLKVDIKLAADSELIPANARAQIKTEFPGCKKPKTRLQERRNSSGEVEELWQLSDQKRSGQCLLLYPDGAIKGESFYKNDLLHGPARFFLPDGSMTSEVWFAEGKRQGYQRQFYADGSLYSAGGYRDDKRSGLHWSFHRDGKLRSKISYCDDQIAGNVLIYHANGLLARRARFQKGERQGWDRQWSKEGRRAFEAYYTQGKPAGVARRWHGNGKLAERLSYLEPGGRVETAQFSDGGLKMCRGIYLDEKRYELKNWDERGRLIEKRSLLWQNGALQVT